MTMGYDDWNNLLPKDLLIDIVQRLSFLEDYYRFTAVCKSWNSAAAATEKPWWLPMRIPMLLLAEEVAQGSILYDCEYGLNQDYGSSDDEGVCNNDDDDNAPRYIDCYDYSKNTVGTSRGLYSLSSMKTYNIDLPEAAGKLILATSKGFLLTLGRDLQINLLHPLLRHQISLPPMLTFPRHCEYHERYTCQDDSEQFIHKVAVSSKIVNNYAHVSFLHHQPTPSPVVMAVYDSGYLSFARPGDKMWTDVNIPSNCIQDIVYHKGNFYAVDEEGHVYVCCIDVDKERGGPRGTRIASIGTKYEEKLYLVEPLSGSGLLLLWRHKKIKHFTNARGIECKYRTTAFTVWRLDLKYCDSLQIPSCTLTKVNNLGNEAVFVGRAASFSVSASAIIKPNSIYFTDDIRESHFIGGGHDMGIFDVEHCTIEPHFQGKSIHCISPPLWYI